ncbi:MAG: tyrosine-type recombinase/integrase, partial [Pseudomonadota bacterium]
RLRALSRTQGWTPHDFRRTATTKMAEAGVSALVVKRVLNHSNGREQGVTAIYNRYDYLTEKAEALEEWANIVTCA